MESILIAGDRLDCMSANVPTLRAFVIDRMRDLGLTQTALSKAAGLAIADINGIVQGRIKLPGADKRRRLASALGVSHLDLLVAAGEITEAELGSVRDAGIGPYIRRLRDERGLTQAQLGDRVGVAAARIAQYAKKPIHECDICKGRHVEVRRQHEYLLKAVRRQEYPAHSHSFRALVAYEHRIDEADRYWRDRDSSRRCKH